MNATNVMELPENVRSKVLKNIAAAGPVTPAIDREILAQKVVDGWHIKLAELKPDIELLWDEFDKLAAGETIMGCSTRTEFCQQHLHVTLRAVRYMLSGGNPVTKRKPQETVSPVDPENTLISPKTGKPIKSQATSIREAIREKEWNSAAHRAVQLQKHFRTHDVSITATAVNGENIEFNVTFIGLSEADVLQLSEMKRRTEFTPKEFEHVSKFI